LEAFALVFVEFDIAFDCVGVRRRVEPRCCFGHVVLGRVPDTCFSVISNCRKVVKGLLATKHLEFKKWYLDGFSSLANRFDFENVHRFFDWDILRGELHICWQVDTVIDINYNQISFIFNAGSNLSLAFKLNS
jgi:hypothetical protein